MPETAMTQEEFDALAAKHEIVYCEWTWWDIKLEDGEIRANFESVNLQGEEEIGPYYCRTCDTSVVEVEGHLRGEDA